jgi:hypothetical protein
VLAFIFLQTLIVALLQVKRKQYVPKRISIFNVALGGYKFKSSAHRPMINDNIQNS